MVDGDDPPQDQTAGDKTCAALDPNPNQNGPRPWPIPALNHPTTFHAPVGPPVRPCPPLFVPVNTREYFDAGEPKEIFLTSPRPSC